MTTSACTQAQGARIEVEARGAGIARVRPGACHERPEDHDRGGQHHCQPRHPHQFEPYDPHPRPVAGLARPYHQGDAASDDHHRHQQVGRDEHGLSPVRTVSPPRTAWAQVPTRGTSASVTTGRRVERSARLLRTWSYAA